MSNTTLDMTNVRRWKRYPEYRPAASDWLDQYPGNWIGLPLKRWVETKITDGPHETPTFVDEGIDFVSAEAVSDGRINFEARRGFITRELHESYCQKCRPQRDDIFLCKSGATTGKLAIVDSDAEFSVWSPLAQIRADRRKATPKYFFWALQADYIQNQIRRTWTAGTQPNISMGSLERLFVVAPKIPEQRAIASFLDRETARIESLVERKERLIALLEEKRQAVISHAVTRGLNPNAPLKDSGIPWLGTVPAHWTVMKLGYLTRIGNGSTPERENSAYWADGDYPWLNSSVVNEPSVSEASNYVTPTALRECHLPIVPAGSVLVAITGEGKTRGKATCLGFEATINQHIAYLTPQIGRLSQAYLQLRLTADYEVLRSMSDAAGSTKGAITCEQLRRFVIPIPPLSEQQAIVTRIGDQTAKLSALKSAAQLGIERLQEYRTALISAAVTGQIDVRGEVPA